MDKCQDCYLCYHCDEQIEFICKHNDYCKYINENNVPIPIITNYDRFMKCTPEQLASVFHNLKENAIYANGRLLNIEDNEKDFLLWLNKKSDDLDSEIFEMRMKKVSLVYFNCIEGSGTVDVEVPFWYEDKEIIPLFKEKLGVEYSPNNCTIVYWS